MLAIAVLFLMLGINLFVIQGIWDGKLTEVMRGVIPFFCIMLVMLLLLWLFPILATWLPLHEPAG